MKDSHSLSKKQFYRIALCPTCSRGNMRWDKAVARCTACHAWYPIVNGVLELVPLSSAYSEDRKTIWKRFEKKHHLINDRKYVSRITPQGIQRKHFDWYATNGIQSYTAYETMAFWKATDQIIFDCWKKIIPQRAIIFDVGCAQGRSIAPFIGNPNTVIGFDISKKMIEAGNDRFKDTRNPPYLFVGDAVTFPVADRSVDVVVLYGVLHHVPHPERIAKEIARVLKPDGTLLSLENNRTPLRFLFDILQRAICLWHEEAGESPTMSGSRVSEWFSHADMTVTTRTHIFLPPHIINMLPVSLGRFLILLTDAIASKIPFICSWGGLIEIVGKKGNAGK